MCTYFNVFELNLTKRTNRFNGDKIKGLKQAFYYLWNQGDAKK